jgi:hypothetical protein
MVKTHTRTRAASMMRPRKEIARGHTSFWRGIRGTVNSPEQPAYLVAPLRSSGSWWPGPKLTIKSNATLPGQATSPSLTWS